MVVTNKWHASKFGVHCYILAGTGSSKKWAMEQLESHIHNVKSQRFSDGSRLCVLSDDGQEDLTDHEPVQFAFILSILLLTLMIW